jgi:hypothetical protein
MHLSFLPPVHWWSLPAAAVGGLLVHFVSIIIIFLYSLIFIIYLASLHITHKSMHRKRIPPLAVTPPSTS